MEKKLTIIHACAPKRYSFKINHRNTKKLAKLPLHSVIQFQYNLYTFTTKTNSNKRMEAYLIMFLDNIMLTVIDLEQALKHVPLLKN